jgi:precorrin-2 dehydrogenase/sirohydrochlorin ferrochelatase
VKYYPVFLNLKGKKAVVIGGGKVAERKVRALLKAGAIVSIISPDITGNLKKFKDQGLITHRKRQYKKDDLKNAFLVIAGTSFGKINKKVAQDAKHLINVIDDPSVGNFIAPSVVNRGPLTIAISTGGASPAVAKDIRKEIESLYGAEFTQYLRFLKQMRKKTRDGINDYKKREEFLKSLASRKIFNGLRNKKTTQILDNIRKEYSKK